MKYFFLLLFFFSGATSIRAQTKFALLDAKDPIVGEWEWIANDTNAPAAPLADEPWKILKFNAGTAQSMGALGMNDDKGYDCPSWFLAFSNGKQISATLSDGCVKSDKGKKFSFEYFYDASDDELLITVRGEKFRYRRKTQ
ncbi:MAG: hypothetical protein HY064_10740 [Bacteroidetes bacterium]|nr:hypothetical protein [Bacteroidota bacterium]